MSILVGREAPDFTSSAVFSDGKIGEVKLSDSIRGKYGLLFFYPLDFTFVCPSELIALNRRVEQFKAMEVEVMAVSIDSQFTHYAWRKTSIDNGGIGAVDYTMVADVSHNICRAYGVEHPDASVALRAAFFIDQSGIVRFQTVHDLMLGRNIEELIRSIKAFKFYEQSGEVCPANWKEGAKGMQASPEGVASYLKAHADDL